MNLFIKILIKELLFGWVIASIMLLIISMYYDVNTIFLLLSFSSALISKVVFEIYLRKHYFEKNEIL